MDQEQASDGSSGLNPRQTAFVAEYLVDLNGTQAAIRAGYAATTANEQSSQLLAKLNIQEAVARGQAQRLARVNLKADEVVVELSALAFSNINHYVIDDGGNVRLADGAPENAMSAIQSIKRKTFVKIDKESGAELYRTYDVDPFVDKPGALKLMGKHANVAACFDSVRLTGPNGGPVELKQVSTEELLARHRELVEAASESVH